MMRDREDSQEVGLEAAILERVRNSSLVEWFAAYRIPVGILVMILLALGVLQP